MAATTTLSQVRKLIRDRLDDQTFDGGVIDRAVNNYVQSITGAHDFVFMETTMSPPTITLGNYTITLPSDYQKMKSFRLTAPSNYLANLEDAYMNYKDFYRMYPSPLANPNGTPITYTEYGQQFIFSQPADQTYTYAMDYIKAPVLLVLDTDIVPIPNEFIECVVSGAVYRIQNRDDDYDLGGNEANFLTPLERSLIQRYASGRQQFGRRMSGGLTSRWGGVIHG
jgi:hypothetical protein